MRNHAQDVQISKKGENLLKQSSLTNPWLYDYIAVYDDRCLVGVVLLLMRSYLTPYLC